jgi:hypothetical protein
MVPHSFQSWELSLGQATVKVFMRRDWSAAKDGEPSHEHWNLVVRHCSYQQSNKQVPEPEVDVEPELFTQAEIA